MNDSFTIFRKVRIGAAGIVALLLLTACAVGHHEIMDVRIEQGISDEMPIQPESDVVEIKAGADIKLCVDTNCPQKPIQKKVQKRVKTGPAAPRPVVAQKKALKPSAPMVKSTPSTAAVKKAKKSKKAKKPKKLKIPPEYALQDAKSVLLWPKFKPQFSFSETIQIEVNYLGVHCGSFFIKALGRERTNRGELMHLYARAKSAEFYKMFYAVDDYLESFVQWENFIPIKYVLVQRESVQTVNDIQTFDRDKREHRWIFDQLKRGKQRNEDIRLPTPFYYQDSFSVFYFLRGLPLVPGDYYEIPVVTRAKYWVLKTWVDKIEEITVMGKRQRAVLVRAETHYPGVLEKKGDILFWFSADPKHIPLHFKAKLKIGSLKGELSHYRP